MSAVDDQLDERPAGTEADFAALMDAAVDAVIVIRESGQIVAFSRAAQQMFGYAADEIIGEAVTVLMPEPYRSEHPGYMDHYRETGEAHIIGVGREVEALRKDGSVFPVWLSVGEAPSPQGRRFVGILRDLTQIRRAERERHALEARLAQVSRLNLLGEMAAGIAHEINQPLTAINNLARAANNVLGREEIDSELLTTACHQIGEQVQRAGQVIQNLRDFVGTREIEKEPIDVNQMIDSALTLVSADAMHAGVSIRLALGDGLPRVWGNAIQLQQVLLNLTKNAVDAMAGVATQSSELLITSVCHPDGMVEFAVADRGPGIPADLQQSVFHPFVTSKQDGLGVGLAISRSIIEAHHGTLRYDARPGEGSTFTVRLPALEPS